MVLRKLRWLVAVVAALAAGPSVSAATIIQVQEVGGSFSQSYTLATLPTSFNTTNFTNVQITVTTSSGTGAQTNHTLSTTLNAQAGTGFTAGSGLTVTVTESGFLNSNPDSAGFFVGNVGTTAAFAFTSNTGTAKLASTAGTTNLGPTEAKATPFSAGSAAFVDPAPVSPNVSSIPDAFSIQQVIDFRVAFITQTNASFTAGVSNSVFTETPAVPAPPALLLALAAVPALGLRRVLGKKA
ncbi:hypothetical protein [Urbifossiella limnaea]|uniref:PEP-CTERM sorting domain-containing protein n=1 Tax=Urbifossiella limnaea TaxID=2528023 RepID=A0A517XR49_9BACT|nr:hypothetical protein [Urbifossiella limnaea]QDU19983.1 hypothetical protein ETAA1_19250 [Urbifossiella limnaea]